MNTTTACPTIKDKHSPDNPRRLVARRARYDLEATQERRAQVVELRAKGRTWDAIAAEVGYSNASAASKAWHRAIAERPALAVDQIREQEASRLEYLFAESVKQIDSPGPRVSAIGKLAFFPAGHPRAGQIVEDEAIRARAIDNARKASADYVRLTGAALTPQGSGLDDTLLRMYAEICAARGTKPALPGPGPAVRLPADLANERADAALARHRAELAAAATPQPGDDDVTDAEVIE